MYYNKVEISGVNTAKLKVLKESEKTELLRQMRSGDPTAREKLINGNLRLVLIHTFDDGRQTPVFLLHGVAQTVACGVKIGK